MRRRPPPHVRGQPRRWRRSRRPRCRAGDTGLPAARAIAPSCATAAPEPRATASPSRGSWKVAHAAACDAESREGDRPVRQAGCGQRRIEDALHEGSGRAQRVRPDPEHHGVARAQDPRRVGEDVGSALEDERDHTQSVANHLDVPAGVGNGVDDAATTGGHGRPTAQPGHHVGAHAVGEHQPGGGAAALGCPLHVAALAAAMGANTSSSASRSANVV